MELKFKMQYDTSLAVEAERNQFKGGNKLCRFLSLFVAEFKCTWYLLWASIARGECMFVGYGPTGRRSLVGTATGSMWDGTLTLRRIFWCENES